MKEWSEKELPDGFISFDETDPDENHFDMTKVRNRVE